MPDPDQWLEAETAPEHTGQYCYIYKRAGKVFLSLGLSNAFPISYSGFFVVSYFDVLICIGGDVPDERKLCIFTHRCTIEPHFCIQV